MKNGTCVIWNDFTWSVKSSELYSEIQFLYSPHYFFFSAFFLNFFAYIDEHGNVFPLIQRERAFLNILIQIKCLYSQPVASCQLCYVRRHYPRTLDITSLPVARSLSGFPIFSAFFSAENIGERVSQSCDVQNVGDSRCSISEYQNTTLFHSLTATSPFSLQLQS